MIEVMGQTRTLMPGAWPHLVVAIPTAGPNPCNPDKTGCKPKGDGGLTEDLDILDVGTGSGYGCALLAQRFGDSAVSSVDVDPYLTEAAIARLAATGLYPRVDTVDATGPLPGTYDRIVSMVSMRVVPASWMRILRPGGRLVMVIAGTAAILTATKDTDGWANGRIAVASSRATRVASRCPAAAAISP